MPRVNLLGLFAVLTAACSQGTGDLVDPFAECWGFQRAADNTYETTFTAVIYPKSGVISYERNCPARRLFMTFNDPRNTVESEIFSDAEKNGLAPTAFSGLAVISVDSRQVDALTLRVTVKNLKQARLLSRKQTAMLTNEMNGAH